MKIPTLLLTLFFLSHLGYSQGQQIELVSDWYKIFLYDKHGLFEHASVDSSNCRIKIDTVMNRIEIFYTDTLIFDIVSKGDYYNAYCCGKRFIGWKAKIANDTDDTEWFIRLLIPSSIGYKKENLEYEVFVDVTVWDMFKTGLYFRSKVLTN